MERSVVNRTPVVELLAVILGLGVSLWSTVGLSYGTTQCRSESTAQISRLERVEEEIWGTNLVTWLYDGQVIESKNVTLDESSIQVTSVVELESETMGQVSITLFTLKATLQIGGLSAQSLLIYCETEMYSDLRD